MKETKLSQKEKDLKNRIHKERDENLKLLYDRVRKTKIDNNTEAVFAEEKEVE